MLAGILTNKDKPTSVSFLAHVSPIEKNFEETILTLQYQEMIKKSLILEVKKKSDGAFAEHLESIENLIVKVISENKGLKVQHDDYVADENLEFDELQKKLGLEYPVYTLLQAPSNSKEATYMSLHREVAARNKNITANNIEVKRKL